MITMGHRGIIHSLIWWLLTCLLTCLPAEKLSPNQQAPLFARGSGGLILKPPFEGARAIAFPPAATNVVNDDAVEREEVAMLKLVDGELVRVVEGHFSYKSPEGIPVSVHYVADENGNRAGFRLGKAATEGFKGSQISVGPPAPGSSTYLPPKTDVDRSYLPPQ